MNIICRKTDCRHNQNFVCEVKHLNIGLNSLCEDYEKLVEKSVKTNGKNFKENGNENGKNLAKKSVEDTSKNMLKKPPKYNPYKSVHKCNICCNADCLFNENSKCHANGITVNDLINSPYCITYFKE